MTPLAFSFFCAVSSLTFASTFSIPEIPQLPRKLPEIRLDIQETTPSNNRDEGPSNPVGSSWDWWGTLNNTETNNDVHVWKQANGYVYGGWSTSNACVEKNRLVLERDAKMKDIYGGYSREGDVQENIVEIYGTMSTESMPSVYAGYSKKGNAIGNMLFVRSGGTVYGTIVGGSAASRARDNVIVIEKDAQVQTSSVIGGAGKSLNGNAVFAQGSTVKGSIYAGQLSRFGMANGNLVYLGSGSQVEGKVIVAWGSPGFEEASNNTLIVDNATVHGRAGAVRANGYQGTDNALYLLGKAVIQSRAGANLDGWQENQYRDTTTGLVHIKGTASVGSLEGFDRLIFELIDENVRTPALTITNASSVLYGEDPILDLTKVTTTIQGEALTDVQKGVRVIATTEGESIHLLFDEQTQFVDPSSIFVDQSWIVSEDIVSKGSVEVDSMFINPEGELVIGLNGNETILGHKNTHLTMNSQTLSESLLGTVAFVNQGAEFIADEGMRAMLRVRSSNAWSYFGAMHGGSSEYETGSHVDVDGVTLVTGASTSIGPMMIAGFVEAGFANSESHVSGANADGDHDYFGLGVALRYSFEMPFYVDGAFRFGRATTEFLGQYANANAQYEMDGFYGSMHLGAGSILPVHERANLELYGRYVMTYLAGDTVDLQMTDGEKFDTKNTVSQALRFGVRLNGRIQPSMCARLGIAYEHVFDGQAESDIIVSGTQHALSIPSLEGNVGILDMGLTMQPQPQAQSPWFWDIGVKAYVGDRQGVSGNATVVYAF